MVKSPAACFDNGPIWSQTFASGLGSFNLPSLDLKIIVLNTKVPVLDREMVWVITNIVCIMKT